MEKNGRSYLANHIKAGNCKYTQLIKSKKL